MERSKESVLGPTKRRPSWVTHHNGDVGHLVVAQTLVKQIFAFLVWFVSHLFILHISFVFSRVATQMLWFVFVGSVNLFTHQ